ncbi:Mitochondrial arginine transporter BAC1 [Linum grandiflorum]
MEQRNPAYKEYLAGLLAGVSTVAIGHPFDTVKVKLQKHNTEAHGVKYRNAFDCTARILQTEGACILVLIIFLSKDFIEEQRRLLLEWQLKARFFSASIRELSSLCRSLDCFAYCLVLCQC